MVDYTRRTHIVRCPADPANPDDIYVDVEVLDALAFRGPGGKELVLRFDQKSVVPYIVDDTGGGNSRSPNNGTRRSHMKRIKSKDGLMDIEVLDVVAFRGPGNKEWILNLPSKKSSAFIKEDGGPGNATRRGHKEKVSDPFGEKDPKSYATVIRTDQVAFRTIMGEEMIIKMPSNDDPFSRDPRASTFVTSPKGYDPKNDDGPKPPINKDKNIYISFPKGGSPITGDEKIEQGMLWWIRKIKGGGFYIRIDVTVTTLAFGGAIPSPGVITLDFINDNAKDRIAELIDETSEVTHLPPPPADANIVYFVWNNFAPFPTVANFANSVTPSGAAYAAQFAYEVVATPPQPHPNGPLAGRGEITTGGPYRGSGFFSDPAAAGYYANIFNEDYSGHRPGFEGLPGPLGGYYDENGLLVNSVITPATVYATSLDVGQAYSPTKTVLKASYLIKIPSKESVIKMNVDIGGQSGSIKVKGYGYSDCPPLKVVSDAGAFDDSGSLTPPDATVPDTPIKPPDVVEGTSAETFEFKITTEVLSKPPPALKPHHVQIVIDDNVGGDGDEGASGGSGPSEG